MRTKHRRITALLGLSALLLAAVAYGAVACDDGAIREPSAAGPYGVGVTEMTFTRTSSTTGEPRVMDSVIWYPADSGAEEPVTDAPPATSDAPFPS